MAVGHSLDVQAPPERVWAIWSDPATWGSWNPDVASVELDGPFRVGASGTMHTRAGRHHRIEIEAIEPGRAFRLAAWPIPATTFHFECRVDPAAGGCRISQAVGFGGLGVILGPLMGKGVAGTFPAILAALKAKAEASGAASS